MDPTHHSVYMQETNRRRRENTANAVIDERTLQEIYTRPWASAAGGHTCALALTT